MYAQSIQLKERLIEEIQHMMRLGDLTWEDIEPVMNRRKTNAEVLRSLAGAWKDKNIDALGFQNQIREELETLS